MITIRCNAPDCKSCCTLSPLDADRTDAALKDRGWVTCGTGSSAKHYCQFHKNLAKEPETVTDGAPVPSTD